MVITFLCQKSSFPSEKDTFAPTCPEAPSQHNYQQPLQEAPLLQTPATMHTSNHLRPLAATLTALNTWVYSYVLIGEGTVLAIPERRNQVSHHHHYLYSNTVITLKFYHYAKKVNVPKHHIFVHVSHGFEGVPMMLISFNYNVCNNEKLCMRIALF